MTNFDESLLNQIAFRSTTAGVDEIHSSIARELPPSVNENVALAASLRFPKPADIGRAFKEHVIPFVKDGICGKAQFCSRRQQYDTVMKIVSLTAEYVTDAIEQTGHFPPGTKPATKLVIETSAAILKEGLNSLCGCPESTSS
ncbi:MAG TPA: hypothetical protein VGC72_14850 [Candidatus Elarobacter sp.]|jgi:hypothetical protein